MRQKKTDDQNVAQWEHGPSTTQTEDSNRVENICEEVEWLQVFMQMKTKESATPWFLVMLMKTSILSRKKMCEPNLQIKIKVTQEPDYKIFITQTLIWPKWWLLCHVDTCTIVRRGGTNNLSDSDRTDTDLELYKDIAETIGYINSKGKLMLSSISRTEDKLGPPWFNYWFSFTLAHSRISHE